jgi:beta-galactosidase
VLYITSRRFTERTNPVTDVKIYSNAKDPWLLINGVSQGQSGGGTNGVFVWKGVRLTPGKNIISSSAEFNGHDLADQCTWNLSLAP